MVKFKQLVIYLSKV